MSLDAEIYDWAGLIVQDLVRATRDPAEAHLLDVGAGQGKYRHLLPEFVMDACEIWEPAVDEFNLRYHYRHVFIRDFYDLVTDRGWPTLYYDVIVMGDVLEHLPRHRAQIALRAALERSSEVIVVVPYRYPQDAHDGNVYQRHAQADLTPEVVVRRYPELELLALETRDYRAFKGIYRGRQAP